MNIALILAGGVGTRFGAEIPKQFIKVKGKPILIYCLESFENDSSIDEIVLVCVESYIGLAKELCEKYGIKKLKMVVPGGASFLESCMKGMEKIGTYAALDDIVVITSADRPMISAEEIDDSIDKAVKYGSGIAAKPCALCMFETTDDRSCSSSYKRDNLMQAATPWSFKYGLLEDALNQYVSGNLKECESYPTAIYVAAGYKVYFSVAKSENMKITEKKDIVLFEQMI